MQLNNIVKALVSAKAQKIYWDIFKFLLAIAKVIFFICYLAGLAAAWIFLLGYFLVLEIAKNTNKPATDIKELPVLSATTEKLENKPIEEETRIFIAAGANRAINARHFLGYTPGGEGGGVNYQAFRDFHRSTNLGEMPRCLPITGNYLEKRLWEQYEEKYCVLPLITASELQTEKSAAVEAHVISDAPATEEQLEMSVDSSPAISSQMVIFQASWDALAEVSRQLDKVKASELKAVAQNIKGYRRLNKGELLISLMNSPA